MEDGNTEQVASYGCVWNYVVTAQKPTSITDSVVGHFTASEELNLIISKSTRIEIHLLTPEGLQPLHDVPIYGRIATMKLFRPEREKKDLLFISTERYKFCVLGYENGEIITHANGDVQDRIGRPADVGQIGIIDPDCRLIGLHLYDGLFKVIPMDPTTGQLQDAFNIRLEELQVVDIQFLYGCNRPTICVLYQDQKEARHIKTYEILLKEKEFGEGAWSQPNVEASASMIIPVPEPLGGAIIVGEQTITYHHGNSPFKSVSMKATIMKAYGRVDRDGSRHLFGDHLGNLFVLILHHDQKTVIDLKLECLGQTSCSSTLSYLDNGVVYLGSLYGDPQLIKLTSQPDETGSYIEVLDTFPNLGPIVDFVVVDLERQGQGQVVTCSGAFKDGSLRIIRNGIGINEQAQIELAGLKGAWSLRASSEQEYDKYLVLSFISQTLILAATEEDLEKVEVPAFNTEIQTLYCGNATGNHIIQITEESVRMIDSSTQKLVAEWKDPAGGAISLATANSLQILVSTAGGNLFLLEIVGSALVIRSTVTMENEIACMDITPLEGLDVGYAKFCAVGLWKDMSIRLLSLPELKQLAKESLGGDVIPRSLLFASFEGDYYLLCALGDGHLVNLSFYPQEKRLGDRKKVALATQPIVLSPFRSNGKTHVFACSDRPTVIYSANKKILYSNVNLKDVKYMCSFNTESFSNSLALCMEQSLTIGSIDSIQKLHIDTIPLREMPRRICHHSSSSHFVVLTVRTELTDEGEEETCYVRLIDDSTLTFDPAKEKKDTSFKMKEYENGCSVISCTFTADSTEYIVVGTATAKPQEAEPTKGRILVFRIVDSTLVLVHEREARGAVYSLNAFNGKLIACINSKIQLFKWEINEATGSHELIAECGHQGHILALFAVSRGDFIVVGDLMKSISLLAYKPINGSIEEIARDYNPNWMTAIEILDDDTYIGAENSFNLFTLRKNSDAATDEERRRLELIGEFHLGEFVNRFRHGSLVMKQPEGEGLNLPTLIFGTVNGAVGVVASLPQPLYASLQRLQENLARVIKGIGGFSHEQWRSFSNERKTVSAKGFVDGDLIEAFLDLPRSTQEAVVQGLDISVDDVVKQVEALVLATH